MIHPLKIHYIEITEPHISLCGLKDPRFERVSSFRHVKCKMCEKAFYARYGRDYGKEKREK